MQEIFQKLTKNSPNPTFKTYQIIGQYRFQTIFCCFMKYAFGFALFVGTMFLTACQVVNTQTPHLHQTIDQIEQDKAVKRIAIQFPPSNHATLVARLSNTIKGYEIIDYTLHLKQGQYLNASLASKHLGTYFNILPPDSDVAVFIGSTKGDQFEGVVPATGEYRIRVYQMRASARRGEVADFGLEIITNKP